VRVIVEQLVEWRLAAETEVLGENPPQLHFVHHKSHLTRPGIELTHKISMPWVVFEPTIPASERAKAVHALCGQYTYESGSRVRRGGEPGADEFHHTRMSVATHTRTSLAYWNPSRVGLASQTRTCMGPLRLPGYCDRLFNVVERINIKHFQIQIISNSLTTLETTSAHKNYS
jgi:hypothetical protein